MIWRMLKFGRLPFFLHEGLQEGTAVEGREARTEKVGEIEHMIYLAQS